MSTELTFELSGFGALKRGNVKLGLGQILTVDATLQVASLQESVTVTAASPVVDMQNTKVGTDFTTAQLVGVPTATDIWAVLGQASGVRMNGFDVGGSHKSQQTGYESFGIRNQNRVLNDGVDTTEGTGGAGFYADYFANEEVAVAAAGGDVEMNAPGSAVVNTIKSGGNTVKMLNNLTYQQESFVGDNQTGDAEKTARGYTGQPNIKFWEGHIDIGGPIVHDKLWYFGAYNHFKIDKQISGVPRNIATDLGLFDNYTTKETWKASEKDTLVYYMQWGRKQKPNRGLSVTVSPEAAQPQDSISWVFKGEHQRVWSSRLFTDVKFNVFGYDFPLGVKADFATQPPRIDTSTNFVTGAAWDAFDLARQKPQVTAQATYYVPDKMGSHDLKVGFEYVLDISKYTIDGRSGPIRYRDLRGATDEIQFVDVGKNSDLDNTWAGANNRNKRYAGYVQDRWNLNSRTTFQLGVRWDYQRPFYLEGKRDPIIKDVMPASVVNPALIGQPMFEARSFPESAIITRNSFAPRLGVSYDVSGKGTTVLKGFYGRFYYNYADGFSALNPSGANYKQFKFNDVNGNRLYDGPQELGAFVSSAGGVSTVVDPNVKKPYADEFDASLEHQFWGESSFRVAYVRKNTNNEISTIDLSRVGHFTVPVTRTITLQEYVKVNGVATVVNNGTVDVALLDLNQAPTRPEHDHELPGRPLPLRHAAVRVQQALRPRPVHPVQLRLSVEERAEGRRRSRLVDDHDEHAGDPERQPAELGSDHDRVLQQRERDDQQPAEEHQLAGPRDGALRVQVRHRRGGQPAGAERIQLRADLQRVAAAGRHGPRVLGQHRREPVGGGADSRPSRRQADAGGPLQVHGDGGSVQRDELERRDELHDRQRHRVQPDHRGARPENVPGRRSVRLLIPEFGGVAAEFRPSKRHRQVKWRSE